MTTNDIYVLFVEDHYDLAATVCDFLESQSITVDHCSNCALAHQLLSEQPYHVIILDINLPDGTGFDICHYLRNELGLNTPTIMLTARDSLDDKLKGFDCGSDDYLVKPFDLPELVARIKALNNRHRGLVGHARYVIDDLLLDVNKNHVERAGQEINLSPIGFQILTMLMRESPNIISRKEIEMEIWGEELPDSDSLRSHLYTLRKSVDKPFENKLIQTVTGVGVKITE